MESRIDDLAHRFFAPGALIIPTFSERESNARRVAALDAGIRLVPEAAAYGEQHLDIQRVRDAVHALLTTTSYRQAAQAVRLELDALTGAHGVADIVETNSA